MKLLDSVPETKKRLNAGSRKRNRKKRDGTDNRYDHKLSVGIRRLGHALVSREASRRCGSSSKHQSDAAGQ